MSKHNNKISKKKKQNNKSKNPIKILVIVFAVIALLAAATVVTVKVIVPKIKDSKKNNTPRAEVTQNYEYVKYGNGELPKDFCEILTVAQQDEALSCKNNGVAYTLGNREFSQPTILMEYIDTYINHLSKASEDMDTLQYSSENMHFDIFPEFVPYDKNQTWYEMMMKESLERLSEECYLFDKALSEGFKMTDEQIQETVNRYEKVIDSAFQNDQEISEIFITTYNTDKITFEIYAAHIIIDSYATAYKSILSKQHQEKVSVKEAENYIKGKEKQYMVFSGRILPITNEVDGTELVKTEEEYIEYAQKVIDVKYDASRYTAADYASYTTVKSIYGDIVADYIFSSDRKSGEISLINNEKYDFLIYIDKPAYYETSVNSVITYIQYNTTDETEIEAIKSKYKDKYDEIVKNGATLEQFANLSYNVGKLYESYSFGYMKERVEDCHFKVNKWLRDPSRKKGDHDIIYIDEGMFIVYFECLNKDDFDWFAKIKNEITLNIIEKQYTYKNNSQYVTNFNSKADEYIQEQSHKAINNYVDFYIVQRFGDTLLADQ